jgi:hypothetical protein
MAQLVSEFQGYHMTQLVSEFQDQQPHLLDQRFPEYLPTTMKIKQTMRKDFTLVITRQICIKTQDKRGEIQPLCVPSCVLLLLLPALPQQPPLLQSRSALLNEL